MVKMRLSLLLVFNVVLALLAAAPLLLASAAVLGIDLGSENLKVSMVKPGRIPISIVENAMSRRKTPMMAAFSEGNRLLGEDAAAIIARYPERVYSRMRDTVGVAFGPEEEEELFTRHGRKHDFVRNETFVGIRTHTGEEYSMLELLGNMIYHAKDMGVMNAEEDVKDAVIVVPAYMGQAQLAAVADAATVAGLNILTIVTDHAAAGLQFGIDRDFSNNTQTIVLYDMGSNSVKVSLMEFSSYPGKDRGKKKQIGQFSVKGIAWDENLGGSDLERMLVDHFADEFNAKYKPDVDLKTVPKSMAKLRKNIKKLKEVLSANNDAHLSVESLYNDIDFVSSISRDSFEKLAGDFWSRAVAPLTRLLEETGMTMDQIDGVEMIGGSTRVPRLQKELTAAVGKLDKHMDGDEAVVFGCGYTAANLSTAFRVRNFGSNDINPYGIQVTTYKLPQTGDDFVPLTKVVAGKWKKSGVPKSINVANTTSDFGFRIEYVTANGATLRRSEERSTSLPKGVSDPVIASYEVTGIKEQLERYNQTDVSSINVHFSWEHDKILVADKATVGVMVTQRVPKKKEKESSAEKGVEDEKESNNDTETTEEAGKDGEKDGKAAEEETATTTATEEPEYEETTIASRVPVKLSAPHTTLPRPTAEQLRSYQRRMSTLRAADLEKQAQAKAKNDLESYIINMRDFLYEDKVQPVTTEEERDTFRGQLMDMEDWLYDEGEDAKAEKSIEQLSFLKDTGDRITVRVSEVAARPEAIKKAKGEMERGKRKVEETWPKRDWLSEDTIKNVATRMKQLEEFIEEKEKAQAMKEATEDPAYLSKEVLAKVETLKDLITSVDNIRKPAEKAKKKEKKKEEEEEEEVKEEEEKEKVEEGSGEEEEATSEQESAEEL